MTKSKLKFLSGFTLGSLLFRAMQVGAEPKSFLGDHYETHNKNWIHLNKNPDFIEGIKLGLKIKEIPKSNVELNEILNILVPA